MSVALNAAIPVTHPLSASVDEEEIRARKAFLHFTEADIKCLRDIHKHLDGYREAFTHTFYAHLTNVPELREMLSDQERLARLEKAQSHYFQQLTGGDYGTDYVNDRIRVGIAHQRIGLDTKWYVGA